MANSATPRFPIADVLTAKGEIKQTLHVRLSAELVHLLSDQMYQSPTKAIEELVVNSFDADAAICRVYVPSNPDDPKFIVVFDDGHGMSEDALVDLWHIGRSNKRTSEVEARTDCKEIGKFGIGKLGTYGVANKIPYITRHEDVCAVTLDFRSFKGAAEDYKVPVEIRRLREPNDLRADGAIQEISTALGLDATQLSSLDHWTFTVIEDLKPKVSALTPNRLRWVLSTAMPLRSDFRLFLNGNEVKSSKEDLETLISFSVGDLPKQRIKSLAKAPGEAWRKKGKGLIAPSFLSGVSGTVNGTKDSVHAATEPTSGRRNGDSLR